MQFLAALSATRGAREYQEDTAALWPAPTAADQASSEASPILVAVLADGMGGHAGGALASRMVCEKFMTAISDDEPDREILMQGVIAANQAVEATINVRPELTGMGSTLVGALFKAGAMHWVSVGDSPLYLYRRGEIALINEDHSLAPALDQLAREGKITAEQARSDPRRHMLRSAVTGETLELVDVSQTPLELDAEDLIIVASDGINTLEDDEIARVVTAYARDGAAAVANAIIRAVEDMRAPHQDNTTVIVVCPRVSD